MGPLDPPSGGVQCRRRVLAVVVAVVVVLVAPGTAAWEGTRTDNLASNHVDRTHRRRLPGSPTFTVAVQSNNAIAVTFSAVVQRVAGGSTTLLPSDFTVSLSGGIASLDSFTVAGPDSRTYTLTLSLSRDPDGVEEVTVDVGANKVEGVAGGVVVASAVTVTLNGVGYPNVAVLKEGKLYMAWLRRTAAGMMDVKLVLQAASAWVGIGLDSNTMVGTAGAVIGAPADGSVRRYNLTATSAAGVVPASVQDLTNTSVSTVGGNTVVTFTMPLPAQPAGTTPLVFAYGAGGSLSSSGEADNGATSVDFTAQPGCDAATSCRGHGACNGTRCVCDTGYVGIDCGVCDVGFKRTSGQSPFDACFSDEATAEVVLLLASSSFGAVGSSTRDTLLGSFEARVAQVVGTAPGHVVVTRVVPRSGLLQFRFKRLVRNTTSAVPVRTMVARFEAAYANASSALFLPASATTQYIDASRPLTFEFATTPPPPVSGVSHSVELMPGLLSMDWVMSDTAVTITVTAEIAAWISIAFNKDASMVGGDAVVGEPWGGAVTEYYMGGKDLPLITRQTIQDLRNVSMGQRDGRTVMQFTRDLDPSKSRSGGHSRRRRRALVEENRPIIKRGQTPVLYAIGTSNTFAAHNKVDRGALYIDFFTGETAEVGWNTLQVLHAATMTVAWFILVPLGVWASMFGRRVEPRGGAHAWWFVRHQALQYSALVVMAAGVVSSYNMVDGHHLATTHSWCGLVLLALPLLQIAAGTLRPGQDGRFRAAWSFLHKTSGRVTLLFAIPTTVLGIVEMEFGTAVLVGFIALVVILCVATAVWWWRHRQLPELPPPKPVPSRRLSMVLRLPAGGISLEDGDEDGEDTKKKKRKRKRKKKRKKKKKAGTEVMNPIVAAQLEGATQRDVEMGVVGGGAGTSTSQGNDEATA